MLDKLRIIGSTNQKEAKPKVLENWVFFKCENNKWDESDDLVTCVSDSHQISHGHAGMVRSSVPMIGQKWWPDSKADQPNKTPVRLHRCCDIRNLWYTSSWREYSSGNAYQRPETICTVNLLAYIHNNRSWFMKKHIRAWCDFTLRVVAL